MNGKKFAIVIITLFACTSSFSDVVVKENGSIYLGRITNINSSEITIDSFGSSVVLPVNTVKANYKDVSELGKTKVNIILKDESVINGTIDNYDDEIGILLGIGFGTLTIPVSSVKEIKDPVVEKKYYGYSAKVGGGFGMYFVTGDLADSYSSSFAGNVYSEFMIPAIRGLFVGVDFSYRHVKYKEDNKMKYDIFSLKPYIMYSFLDFKNALSLFSRITPFVSLYAGAAYTSLEDKRDYVKNKNSSELDPEIGGALGFDVYIAGNVSFRASGCYSMILQKNKSFNAAAMSAGANYGF